MILRDKLGWAVERIKGRPITNALRLLIHTDIRQTWKHRKSQSPVPPQVLVGVDTGLPGGDMNANVFMDFDGKILKIVHSEPTIVVIRPEINVKIRKAKPDVEGECSDS